MVTQVESLSVDPEGDVVRVHLFDGAVIDGKPIQQTHVQFIHMIGISA